MADGRSRSTGSPSVLDPGRLPLPWHGLQRRLRGVVPAPLQRLDLRVFRAVADTDLPIIGPALPPLSRAANHSRLWLVIAALLAATQGRAGRRAGIRGLLSVVVASAVTNLPAKLLTGRSRPDMTIVPRVRHLAHVPTSTSFPSGHSASALAFATGASMEDPRLRPLLLPLAGAVAFSRVYTGVHYPGDVLVGAAIGVGLARSTTGLWPLPGPPATAAPVETEVEMPDSDGTGIVLVANVDAGSSLDDEDLATLQQALPGMRVVEVDPENGLATTLERAADGARVLAVAGGDGTASAGATAAHEAGIPLLLVPAGTLNHLARDLGIDDVHASIRAANEGRVVAMDLAEVDGRLFVNASSIGAYPHLVDAREKLEDTIGKWPAALWCTFTTLVRGTPLDVEIDGEPRRLWLMFFGNGPFSTEGLAPAHREQLDAGLLDIRTVDADLPLARTRVLASMLLGRLGRTRAYERRTAEEVVVRSRRGSLRLACDGECIDGSDVMTVRTRPGALLVLQPSRSS